MEHFPVALVIVVIVLNMTLGLCDGGGQVIQPLVHRLFHL